MNILVTGANGFVGKNLIENLKNIKENKNRTRPNIKIDNIYCYDIDSNGAELDMYCKNADFVFNLAGVNRPKDDAEFMSGNLDFSACLLETMKKHSNKCPIMLSSSTQATLIGRYNNTYGKSKKAAEELFFNYANETGAKVLIYRFPNIFGKWATANYNSAVATFCYNIANDMPLSVNDPKTELELLYIDDLIEEMLDALEGKEHRCEFDGTKAVFTKSGRYCASPIVHNATLGEIVCLLEKFKNQPSALQIPEIPQGSFAKKLYSTYLSYLPKEKVLYSLMTHSDTRGSFTEVIKSASSGQISVNILKPGVTKGQHWHNSKWEIFIVISGHGLISQRNINSGEIMTFEVSGKDIQAVHILPGYTHKITNLSDKEDLITLMWANEQFNPDKDDTYSKDV